MDKLKIEYIKVTEILNWPQNPKKHNNEAIHKSVQEFGARQPIIVHPHNGKYEIVAGHGRIKAFMSEGMTEIPCIIWNEENRARIKAFAVADNQTTIGGGWDDIKLSEIMQDIKLELPDIDFESFGFPDDELRELLGDDIPGEIVEDEVPEVPEEPLSKLGDLWTCGRHRVLCGDATKEEDVKRLMDGKKADLCLTDPPYSVDYENIERAAGGRSGEKTHNRKTDGSYYVDSTDAKSILKFIRFVNADIIVMTYVFNKHFFELAENLKGWEVLYECVWVKDRFNQIMGRRYQPQHEPILFFRRLKSTVGIWNVPANQSTIFSYPSPRASVDHPTPKPLEMWCKLIEYQSNVNSPVYDPFGGSGTTLIAAEQLNRTCFMMELDPKYIDVILSRYYALTNISPVRDDGVEWASLIKKE